jgi:hypothetical protein
MSESASPVPFRQPFKIPTELELVIITPPALGDNCHRFHRLDGAKVNNTPLSQQRSKVIQFRRSHGQDSQEERTPNLLGTIPHLRFLGNHSLDSVHFKHLAGLDQ